MHSVTRLAYIWRIVESRDYMPFDHWGLRTVVEDQSVCVIMLWLLVPANVIDIRHWTKAVSHKRKYTWNDFGNIFIFTGIRFCNISSHAMDESHKNFATPPIKRAVCNNVACTNSDYVITWQSFNGGLFLKEATLHTYVYVNLNSCSAEYILHISVLLIISHHGPPARYVKLRVAYAPGIPGTFSPPPRVSDPDMHHGTCVTHVSWCMSASLTSGFLWSWWRKAFPTYAQPAILCIW